MQSPHRARILLLEDSDLDAELISAQLERSTLDVELERATSRADFERELSRKFDVVLADYSLPDFDGLTALELARAADPRMPFIFVSGVVGEDFATNAVKRGATDYVMKRNLERLAPAVERALKESHERREREKVETALRRTEISAQLATRAAELGVWEFARDTRELVLDAKCKALLGFCENERPTYHEVIARCDIDIQPWISRGRRESPNSGLSFRNEFRIKRGDSERWLAIWGQPNFGGVDDVLVGVLRDVTDERRSREALRELATTLEEQVAQRTAERDRMWRLTPDLLAVVGRDHRVRRANPAWWGLLGYDPAALGHDLRALVHVDDQPVIEVELGAAGGPQALARFETRLRAAAGEWKWISWTAAPESDAFYIVGRDTTAEKAAVVELAERNAALAYQIEERERIEQTLHQMQRLESVGQLTAGVAHDFNNLLTVIIGNLGFLERATPPGQAGAKSRERVGHMRVAAERGAKLTAQLLAFSRKQKLQPVTLDLNELVGGMKELLASTMGGNIDLRVELDGELWPALVDPTQIELVLLNLAINARDAMDGTGTLTVRTHNLAIDAAPLRSEEPGPGEYVSLTVEDTGSGMKPETLARAFEPFFTTKEIGKGSGLGLAQVYGFAKQSGGGVRIASRWSEGTTVSVFLPRDRSGTAAGRIDMRTRAIAGTGGGRRILLVDDDKAVRSVTATMLAASGFEVREAGGGQAALDALRSDAVIDLLLVDYAMPGINGGHVAAEAARLRPHMPVILMTGFADEKALHAVPVDRILRKPFDENTLREAVLTARFDAAM